MPSIHRHPADPHTEATAPPVARRLATPTPPAPRGVRPRRLRRLLAGASPVAAVRRGRARAARLMAVIVWAIATLCTLPTLAHASSPQQADCAAGELCLWSQPDYGGQRTSHELLTVTTEQCTPLPEGTASGSFVNRTGRPVTVYQSAVCDTTGDFRTYPSGSWVPEAPYAVRAFTVWER